MTSGKIAINSGTSRDRSQRWRADYRTGYAYSLTVRVMNARGRKGSNPPRTDCSPAPLEPPVIAMAYYRPRRSSPQKPAFPLGSPAGLGSLALVLSDATSRRSSPLTAQDLDDLYDRKLEAGIGSRTVRYVHQTASVALQNAVKKRLIPHNPARDADPPPMPKRENTVILKAEQIEKFVEAANGTPYEALFLLGLCTALRPGELLGALWEDIEFFERDGAPEGTLYVRHSLSETRKHGLVPRDTTKTNRHRAIALTAEAVAILKAHRTRQAEAELKFKGLWQSNGIVFPNSEGGYMSGGNLTQRHLKPILKKAGLPKETRLYDLRHSFATDWIESGGRLEVLQNILGHSSFQVTVDRYVKISGEFQRQSMERYARQQRSSGGAG